MKCPVCLRRLDGKGFEHLAGHLLAEGGEHDGPHFAWLRRYSGKTGLSATELEPELSRLYDLKGDLKGWIIRRLIERIYGDPPHPFILRLQHPDRKTIYGYVMEHHHFLDQWVKSCASIIAKTDVEEVQLYEIDNIVSEFRGIPPDRPSHHELLLRMGESIGVDRAAVYNTRPLPATAGCIGWWQKIAEECTWIETMAAMHTLELTANPDIKKMGSKLTYFDPSILEDGSYTDEMKQFLYEGYQADAGHSMDALELIDRYSTDSDVRRDVQSVVFKTVELLDTYLMARLERGESLGN